MSTDEKIAYIGGDLDKEWRDGDPQKDWMTSEGGTEYLKLHLTPWTQVMAPLGWKVDQAIKMLLAYYAGKPQAETPESGEGEPSKPNFHVGQKLYILDTLRRKESDLYETEITRIGRKWVYYNRRGSEKRFEINDPHMQEDGGKHISQARAYLDPADREQEVLRDRLQRDITNATEFREMDKLPTSTLKDILGLLKGGRE